MKIRTRVHKLERAQKVKGSETGDIRVIWDYEPPSTEAGTIVVDWDECMNSPEPPAQEEITAMNHTENEPLNGK